MKKLDNEGRTTSLGLLCFAKEYFKAYEILCKDGGIKWTSPVCRYLLCHGMELSLKAFLKNRGKTVKELYNLGHDLDKIMEACKGLNERKLNVLTQHDWAVISLLNQEYKSKELEYIKTGVKTLPSDKDINQSYENIKIFIQSITQDCSDSREREACPLPLGEGRKEETNG